VVDLMDALRKSTGRDVSAATEAPKNPVKKAARRRPGRRKC
jgi:non-homologous end joining protein Ku